QVRPAPAGHEAEERLGQRERRDTRRDGPVGAVQAELDAAAHRRAVVVGEGRDVQLAEPPEHVMAQPGDRERVLPGPDQGHAVEVGADGEDERLPGDADRRDVVARGDLVEGGVQLREPVRAERVGLRVVVAVVERDEGEGARAVREGHVPDVRARDDLVTEELRQLVTHYEPSHFTFSQSTVPPMPMPTHIVVSPYRTSVRSSNRRESWFISRTPDEASGWPRAIAPPHGFTRGSSSGILKCSRNASTCTANASLISMRPMSSIVSALRARSFSVAGTGPTPMTSGSTPAKAKSTSRIRAVRPSSRATSSAASRQAVAPSLRPAALPAVTLPWTRKGVFSPARSSSVVPGRGGSSSVASPQPFSAERTAVGARSGWIFPAA